VIGGYILLNAGSNLASSLGLGGGGAGSGSGSGVGPNTGPGTGPNPNPGPGSFPYSQTPGGILESPGQTIGNIGIGVGILGAGYGAARYIIPPVAQRIGSYLGGGGAAASEGGAEVASTVLPYDATITQLAAGGDIAAGGVGLLPRTLALPGSGSSTILGRANPSYVGNNAVPSLLNRTTQKQIGSALYTTVTRQPAATQRANTRRIFEL
jgi:hypothetical protein